MGRYIGFCGRETRQVADWILVMVVGGCWGAKKNTQRHAERVCVNTMLVCSVTTVMAHVLVVRGIKPDERLR